MCLWVTAHRRISPLRPLNPWHHIADFVTHSEGMLREESGLCILMLVFFGALVWYLLFHLAVLNGKNTFLLITAAHPSDS